MLFNDEELGAYAKHITTQAKIPHRWEFRHDHIGYNYRMPNINAALGCAQMEHLDEFVENKRATAEAYKEYFAHVDGVEFFAEPENCRSNYWLNAVLLPNREAQQEFLQYTNDHGVMTLRLTPGVYFFFSTMRTRRQRFVAERGRVSMISTRSPSPASLFSS